MVFLDSAPAQIARERKAAALRLRDGKKDLHAWRMRWGAAKFGIIDDFEDGGGGIGEACELPGTQAR